MSRRNRPVVSEILDTQNLAAFKTADETTIVAYLDATDRDSFGAFEDLAREHQDEFSFGTVSSPELAESQGVQAPAVVSYKLVDGEKVTLKGFQGAGELDKWYRPTVCGSLCLKLTPQPGSRRHQGPLSAS